MANKKETVPTAAAGGREDLEPGFSYNELIDELTKGMSPCLDKEHEVTVSMLSLVSGAELSTCRRILDRKVQQDGWMKRMVRTGERGTSCYAFHDPKKWSPKEVLIEQSRGN